MKGNEMFESEVLSENGNLVLILAETSKGRVDEVHRRGCNDVFKKVEDSIRYGGATFVQAESIDQLREWYDVDAEEMGWYFDDTVRVFPCSHKN